MDKNGVERIQEAFRVMEERKRIAKAKLLEAQQAYDQECMDARAAYNKIVDAAEDNSFKGIF